MDYKSEIFPKFFEFLSQHEGKTTDQVTEKQILNWKFMDYSENPSAWPNTPITFDATVTLDTSVHLFKDAHLRIPPNLHAPNLSLIVFNVRSSKRGYLTISDDVTINSLYADNSVTFTSFPPNNFNVGFLRIPTSLGFFIMWDISKEKAAQYLDMNAPHGYVTNEQQEFLFDFLKSQIESHGGSVKNIHFD